MAAPTTEAVRTIVMAPGIELDDSTANALDELCDRQEARLVARQRSETSLRRAVKAATAAASPPGQDDHAPTPDVDISSLAQVVEWPELPRFGEMQSATTDAPPSGEFRPVLTELRHEGGLGAENLSDGTHFFGSRQYGGDDLIRFSVGATSHFKLSPEDIPSSGTGRYRSAPPADAHGQIFGLTGHYLPVFASDDKWCHCFRVLRHALWQLVNGQWRALGELQRVDTLIHLENVVQVGTATVPLDGFMPTPTLEFGLVDSHLPVWAQVEIRFDIDLEGDALIRFSPDQNPAHSVVVRTFGWWACAV
jgi:hypothetical protein